MEEQPNLNLMDNFEAGSSNPSLCGICWLQYSQDVYAPITLRCGHTFCRKCVQTLGSRRGYSSFHCGTCREKVHANPTRLAKNFQLIDLLKKFNLLREDPEVDETANQNNAIEERVERDVANHLGFLNDIPIPPPPAQILVGDIPDNGLALVNGDAQNQPNDQNMELADVIGQALVQQPAELRVPVALQEHPEPNQPHENQPAVVDAQNQVTIDPPNPQVMAEVVELCESLREMIDQMHPTFEELRRLAQNFQGDASQFRAHLRGIIAHLMDLSSHSAYREISQLYRRQQEQLNPQQAEERRRQARMFQGRLMHPAGAVRIGGGMAEEIRLQEILLAQYQQQIAGVNQENAANVDGNNEPVPVAPPQNQNVADVAGLAQGGISAAELMEIMRALHDDDVAGDGAAQRAAVDNDDNESLVTMLEIGIPRAQHNPVDANEAMQAANEALQGVNFPQILEEFENLADAIQEGRIDAEDIFDEEDEAMDVGDEFYEEDIEHSSDEGDHDEE